MIAFAIGALSSAGAVECPDGWMNRGCPAGVRPQNGCCPTRAFCEEELAIELRKAARRHLGTRYDEKIASYDEEWGSISALARQCIDALDLVLCAPARLQLDSYLRHPAEFQLRITGGNSVVRTACGEERVFFDGDTVSFDVPHRKEARDMRTRVHEVEQAIVHPGTPLTPAPEFRPAGAPPAKASNLPAGVSETATTQGVQFGMFYTTTGQPSAILDQLRTFKGRFDGCYAQIHPGWRMAPAEFVMAWTTTGGHVERIEFPHDGMGHPELRSCLSGVLANLPMSRIRNGRSSLVFTVSNP